MVSLEKVPMFPQHIFVSLVLFLSHPSGVATAAFFFMPLLVFCLLSSFVKRINLGKKTPWDKEIMQAPFVKGPACCCTGVAGPGHLKVTIYYEKNSKLCCFKMK